jgi:phosphatidate cytidylyltransferase
MTKMTKRVIFGSIMIAVLAAILWGDWRLEQYSRQMHRKPYIQVGRSEMPAHLTDPVKGLPVAVVMGLISAAGFLELRRFAASNGARMLSVSGILATVLLATSTYWFFPLLRVVPGLFQLNPIYILPLVASLVFGEQMIRRRTQDAFRDLAATILAVAYVGGGGAAILAIRMQFGVPALVLFLVAAKSTDIGAYFTGSFIGKHKLIPWLSPGKTWEGLVGGLVVAAGMCTLLSALAGWCDWRGWVFDFRPTWEAVASGATSRPIPHLPPEYAKPVIFGAAVGLVGQFSDLCESLLKRSASLKDSGALVPEFGGVLDIIDSLLLSAPVAAILLAVMA